MLTCLDFKLQWSNLYFDGNVCPKYTTVPSFSLNTNLRNCYWLTHQATMLQDKHTASTVRKSLISEWVGKLKRSTLHLSTQQRYCFFSSFSCFLSVRLLIWQVLIRKARDNVTSLTSEVFVYATVVFGGSAPWTVHLPLLKLQCIELFVKYEKKNKPLFLNNVRKTTL